MCADVQMLCKHYHSSLEEKKLSKRCNRVIALHGQYYPGQICDTKIGTRDVHLDLLSSKQ